MTTHDNRPATDTPDFICPAGNRCGCSDSNDCTREQPCCGLCVHPATAGSTIQTGARDIVYPVAYYGD